MISNPIINSIGISSIGLNLFWQSLLLAIVVYLALYLLPRTDAQNRYRIALLGFFGSLCLLAAPFLPEFSRQFSVGVSVPAAPIQPLPQSLSALGTPALGAPVLDTSTHDPSLQIFTAATEHLSMFNLTSLGHVFAVIWVLGSLLMLIRLVLATRYTKTWRAHAVRTPLNQSSRLSLSVPIYRSAHISAPMVIGLLRPAIFVPKSFSLDLDKLEIRAVLEHEIAHIVRKDLWVNFTQILGLAVLWWCVPLYWIHNQINIEREKICDDIAAHKAGNKTRDNGRALARALVGLAEQQRALPTPLMAIGIHPPHHAKAKYLAERVHRLYTGIPMTKISKKLLFTSSLAVPVALVVMTIATPRAYARHPHDTLEKGYQVKDYIVQRLKAGSITPAQLDLYANAERGNRERVKELLLQNVDPNFVLHGDGTPLLVAVRRDDSAMTDMFLAAGADVNLKAIGDGTPLIAAARRGRLDMATHLLDKNADINGASRGDGNPLIAATQAGHLDMVKLLVKRGANVNASVKGDETPLINAAQQGHLDIAKYLLASDADINLGAWAKTMKGRTWRTPLGEAKLHRHTKLAAFLQANGARQETQNYDPSSITIAKGRVSSAYGLRAANVKKGITKLHKGIDIANKIGTPIYAPADGRITAATNRLPAGEMYGTTPERYGKVAVLETAGGVTTLFAHLDSFAAQQGDDVKAGDLIGYMGNTGASTGAHVHIETRIDGERVNPEHVWPNLR
jgi:murein DD-endopeptidase MepM/ murein hydrolase activator NlpD/beta-lactamase regulating signal transducer with metallopeptidase domain